MQPTKSCLQDAHDFIKSMYVLKDIEKVVSEVRWHL
jgi:hypothetical protein